MDFLEKMTLIQLKDFAKEKNIEFKSKIKKSDLLNLIKDCLKENAEKINLKNLSKEQNHIDISKNLSSNASNIEEKNKVDESKKIITKDGLFMDKNQTLECGILEIMPDGYGFLRGENYLSTENDIYVPQVQIKRFKMHTGDLIKGIVGPPNEGEKFRALRYVQSINNSSPLNSIKRQSFDSLTPLYPREKFNLQNSNDTAMKIIDIISPIGKGQRGLIVSPPKAGKTTIIKALANAIKENNKEVELIILLIDERPEEVTEMKTSVEKNGDVVYSTFDEMPQNHIKVAEMVLNRAKSLVEQKKDVVILLDSITRLARAYNLTIETRGKTLSGGLDPNSLFAPKKFFGAARNTKEGGSLTIIATALVETGSKMDDVIFEEFKGTGNMELVLKRDIANKRIFPAIDIEKSGTRKEELLLSPETLKFSSSLRRNLNSGDNIPVLEKLIKLVENYKNEDLVNFNLK